MVNGTNFFAFDKIEHSARHATSARNDNDDDDDDENDETQKKKATSTSSRHCPTKQARLGPSPHAAHSTTARSHTRARAHALATHLSVSSVEPVAKYLLLDAHVRIEPM